MSIKDIALNAVTFGGHDQLQAAKKVYESAHSEYELSSGILVALQHEQKAKVQELGNLVIKSLKIAKKSKILIRNANDGRCGFDTDRHYLMQDAGQPLARAKIDRVLTDYSEVVGPAGGAGIGAATAAGAYSLIGLVGAASTGTAISTLSGVAATNAILAWLGGGALAAGGAGIAGGTLVLGGIFVAPVFAIATWHSRSRTKELVQETEKIRHEHATVLQNIDAGRERLSLVERRLLTVLPVSLALTQEFEKAKSRLYPILAWSLFKRKLSQFFGYPFYNELETESLKDIDTALSNLIECFDVSK